MPHLTQGILISIEGIDGSGKSTLVENLSALFSEKKYHVLSTREPGGSCLGKKIREIVQQKTEARTAKAEFLLFAADRAQHFDEVVIPALDARKLIFSDRLLDSSIAYQGYGNNLDIEHIKSISYWAMNDITPHLTIFVNIPVTTALERVSQRKGSLSPYEKKDFLDKVAHGFTALYAQRTNVIIVDGLDTPEELAHSTYSKIEKWLTKNEYIL